MSADTVCRVCLVDEMNLYCVGNDLQNVYERLTGEKYNKVEYPVHMCYVCLAMLRKCHRFMEAARVTNNVLKQRYKQQNEMRVARPLYTYSITKAELVFTYNDNLLLQNDIKVEKVKSELAEDQPVSEYPECNTFVDIEKTDIDERTDYSELLVDSTINSSYTDTIEGVNDGDTDPLCNYKKEFDETSSLAPNLDDHTNIETPVKLISQHDNGAPLTKKRKTIKTKPQHQAPGTSGETAANTETSNDITPLNSTPSQPDNLRHRNNKTKPIFGKNKRSTKKTAKSTKIVKTNVIQKKNEKAVNNKTNKKNLDKLLIHASFIEENEINTCHYKTTPKQNITRHLESNTDEKQFACDDYKSRQKVNLQNHMRTHTGEKIYSCDICNYKCAQKRRLLTHMRIHTGEKPFACDICKRKFKQKKHLRRHMITHTDEKPYSCETCHCKFRQKHHLKTHKRIHTGEKPYSCDICNHKFTQNGVLVQHMRTHTGEKPFLCEICDYKCARKSNLLRHMRTHTG